MTAFYLNLIRLYFYHVVVIAMGKVRDAFWYMYEQVSKASRRMDDKSEVARDLTLKALFDEADDRIAIDSSLRNEHAVYAWEAKVRARFSLIAND